VLFDSGISLAREPDGMTVEPTVAAAVAAAANVLAAAGHEIVHDAAPKVFIAWSTAAVTRHRRSNRVTARAPRLAI
jgi:Asp-tRNA(Asn)/Glu-tRNA(Gln) amidotransferase A subunit family amidase